MEVKLWQFHPRGWQWALRAVEEDRVYDYVWDGESLSAAIVGDHDVYVTYIGPDGWFCSCLGSLRKPCKHVMLLALYAIRRGDVSEDEVVGWLLSGGR